MTKKAEEMVPVGYRVPREVVQWLRKKAEREDRSQNWILNQLLRKAMTEEVRGAA